MGQRMGVHPQHKTNQATLQAIDPTDHSRRLTEPDIEDSKLPPHDQFFTKQGLEKVIYRHAQAGAFYTGVAARWSPMW